MINKINLYLSMLILLAMFFTCGCTISNHTKADAKRQENAGKPIVEEYLSSICDSYEIIKYEMEEGRPKGYAMYTKAYESDYVYCNVLIDGNKYNIYANTQTKEVWSDYYGYLINEMIKKQLEPVCKDHGLDSDITVLAGEFNYPIYYDGPNKLTLEVTIQSCIPAEITPDTVDSYSGDFMDEMMITGLAMGYSSDLEYDELAAIADDYYLAYQPKSYAKIDAGFATYKISDSDLQKLISESANGNVDFSSAKVLDYNFFGLNAVESEAGYSEIFWKYKKSGEENFSKYVVYEAE